MIHLIRTAFISACSCFILQSTFAQNDFWPKEISTNDGGKITIYQPQPENLTGNKLSARSAVSVRKSSNDEPVFGAVWYDANLLTDKDSRTATIESVTVKQTKINGITNNEDLRNFAQLLENEMPKWNYEMSVDQLLTSLQQEQQINGSDINNDAPKIIYTTTPSTLITIDGAPRVQMDDNLNIERVINSPFLIVKNPDDQKYYLYGGGFWYSSPSVTSGYISVKRLPSKIKNIDGQMKEQEKEAAKEQEQVNQPTSPTEIIVSTEPAELLQTEGEATFKSIQGTSLLYADNSLDEIFKDINTQKNYILIAGRWYSSPSLNGPWTYVPSDQLPQDFSSIPPGSEKDGVLASVAGTNAAQEAVMDAQIPQTAKVDRKTATCDVYYDGEPKFSAIENTSLYVAENSNITVIKANNKYYAVDNGVWFVSNQATGPWQVSTERPADIENIPPQSNAYNTKYVYIYDVTPDYIYTGYTPGYLGSYTYGPTVVWGTGWNYSPWYGHYYYPRPVTWGFGMNYNPWTGWNMGFNFGFNVGWFHYGYNNYGRQRYGSGWFGPPAFRPSYRPWGYNGGYYGRRQNNYVGRPNVTINRPVVIKNNITINNYNTTNNLYKHRKDVQTRDVVRQPGNNGLVTNPASNNRISENNKPMARPVPKMPNNVFADKDGNVFKKDNDGWKQTNNKNWNPAPQNRLPDLNKDKAVRDRGVNRERNFQQATIQRPVNQPAPRPENKPAARPAPKPVQKPAAKPGRGN